MKLEKKSIIETVDEEQMPTDELVRNFMIDIYFSKTDYKHLMYFLVEFNGR
jgi:hypothetical protein